MVIGHVATNCEAFPFNSNKVDFVQFIRSPKKSPNLVMVVMASCKETAVLPNMSRLSSAYNITILQSAIAKSHNMGIGLDLNSQYKKEGTAGNLA